MGQLLSIPVRLRQAFHLMTGVRWPLQASILIFPQQITMFIMSAMSCLDRFFFAFRTICFYPFSKKKTSHKKKIASNFLFNGRAILQQQQQFLLIDILVTLMLAMLFFFFFSFLLLFFSTIFYIYTLRYDKNCLRIHHTQFHPPLGIPLSV